MLRRIIYNQAFIYIILLLITFVLWIPAFLPHYWNPLESFYLAIGERISMGHAIYSGAWLDEPPLLAWIYGFFESLFNSYAPTALRIVSALYVWLTAVFLNQFAAYHGLMKRHTVLPAILTILLFSLPWYNLVLTPELLMVFPWLVSLHLLLLIQDDSDRANSYAFQIGLLLGICLLIKFSAVILFIGVLLGYFILYRPRFAPVFSVFSGTILIFLIAVLVMYLKGSLPAFWEQSVLLSINHSFDSFFQRKTPLIPFYERVIPWLGILILSKFGFFHYRVKFYTLPIRVRKAELLCIITFVSALVYTALSATDNFFNAALLCVPMVALYASKTPQLKRKKILRYVVLAVTVCCMTISYYSLLLATFPNQGKASPVYNATQLSFFKTYLHKEKSVVPSQGKPHPAWVIGDLPELYQKLNIYPATPYISTKIFEHAARLLHPKQASSLFSFTEPVAEIYRNLKEEPPEYLIDNNQYYPKLKNAMPLLMQHYHKIDSTNGYIIYLRK